MTDERRITLRRGQALSWDESPAGVAQIDELCRTNVVLGWYDRGRWRLRRVPVRVVVAAMRQQLLVHFNPFDRAVRPIEKTFNF